MKPTDKLAAAIWEADRHLATLAQALAEWDRAPATDWKTLEADRDRVRLVDQLLFRFIKLQDAVGERLVPASLTALDEPYEDWSMRDRLNRLEKLGYLDVDNWLTWREVRNRLAHEYPDKPELRFAALLAAINAAHGLATLYRQWRARLETAGLLGPGKPQE
jgi:hypothetical protein